MATVPIFANSAATQATASVGTSATQIYNTSASGIPAGVTLKNLTIVNTGSVTFYVGQSGVTSSTGLPVTAGTQVTIDGYSYAQGASGGNVYAITASGTSSALAGLSTVIGVD